MVVDVAVVEGVVEDEVGVADEAAEDVGVEDEVEAVAGWVEAVADCFDYCRDHELLVDAYLMNIFV